MTDHDRLFKELISTFFLGFMELFLPEVRAYIEDGSLEFLDKEIFTDVTSGERHEADLVAKLRFKEHDTVESSELARFCATRESGSQRLDGQHEYSPGRPSQSKI